MSAATPTKRHALGALDLNALTRSPSRSATKLAGKASTTSPLKKTARHATTPSPAHSKASMSVSKKRTATTRALDEPGAIASPAFKKLCAATAASPVKAAVEPPKLSVEDAEGLEDSPPASACRSFSPDASSLFDNSTINTSQLTNITEPDLTAPIMTTTAAAATSTSAALPPAAGITDLPPLRPRRVAPTRQEFRQRAEILKLRLSLASYKVKTDQTDIPLDKLQVRPVPGMEPRQGRALPSMSAHTVQVATAVQYWYRSLAPPVLLSSSQQTEESEEGEEGALLPRGGMITPPRKRLGMEEEVRLSSSGLRGGAAKGLLSLSQASS